MRSTVHSLTAQKPSIANASTALSSHWNGGMPVGGRPEGTCTVRAVQRVAVVKVGRKIHSTLHFVDHADHIPGHAGGIGDLVVAWLASAMARTRASVACTRTPAGICMAFHSSV